MDSPLEVKDWSMIVSKFGWLRFPTSKNSRLGEVPYFFHGLRTSRVSDRDGWCFFPVASTAPAPSISAAVMIVLDLLTTADFSPGTNKSPLECHVKTAWKSRNATTVLTVVRTYPKMSINGTDIKTWHFLCGWQISYILAPFYSSCGDLHLQDHHHHQHDQNHQYHPQTIHVWYIYLHLVDLYGKCR